MMDSPNLKSFSKFNIKGVEKRNGIEGTVTRNDNVFRFGRGRLATRTLDCTSQTTEAIEENFQDTKS